jgi:hypothetical protein
VYWATISDSVCAYGRHRAEAYAPGQGFPRWLAIDQTALYWTNAGELGQENGEIRRNWLEGGTPGGLAIVSGLASPHALSVTNDAVYFTNYGVNDTDGRTMAALLTGENPTEIAPNQSDPRGIAAGASHVYWVNTFDGTIMRSRLDGTDVTALISGRSTPSDIAVDSQGIYWVEAGTASEFSDGLVMAARLDGSELTTIAEQQLDPRRIELDAEHVYWINRGTQGVAKCSQHDGAVMRADRPW